MSHVGENIARIRGMRRFTQKEMADKLGMTQPEYSRTEQKAQIDSNLLERVASVLGVKSEFIENFKEDSVFTNNIYDQNNSVNQVYFQSNPIEKIVELYDKLLKEKDEIIEMYKKQLKA